MLATVAGWLRPGSLREHRAGVRQLRVSFGRAQRLTAPDMRRGLCEEAEGRIPRGDEVRQRVPVCLLSSTSQTGRRTRGAAP